MLKDLLRKWITRNHFDPSSQDRVSPQDFVKILQGKVYDSSTRVPAYFIVCQQGIAQLNREGEIQVDELTNVVDEVFNKSVWFGKFGVKGKSQIIVPHRYDLGIIPQEKKICLQATEMAIYYGNGNLQLDKDVFRKVLRTNIGFEELRNIVNSTCSGYQYAHSLQAWNK